MGRLELLPGRAGVSAGGDAGARVRQQSLDTEEEEGRGQGEDGAWGGGTAGGAEARSCGGEHSEDRRVKPLGLL